MATRLRARFTGLYGASPLHLLAYLASFAIAGYSATALLHRMTLRVLIWFVGAAVGHDLILVPLYSIANLPVSEVWRRVPLRTDMAPWLNYVRFPAVISGVLLVIYFPEISRRRTSQLRDTGLSNHPYFSHWLLVTGILFALSAITYAVRLRRTAKS